VWISYLVSYAFIAVVWINHHYILKHATEATVRLMWVNFAHLFSVSLIPFLTDWISETRLAPIPVMMYAWVFVLVNVTYLMLIREVMYHGDSSIPPRLRHLLLRRAIGTIPLFGAGAILALWFPDAGFVLICICLVIYLRPGLSARKGKRRPAG